MFRICIIAVYFGKLPNYFNLWIESCKENPEFDFLLVTDNQITDLPTNVKILNSNLQTIRLRLRKILGFEPALESAYKLCDYRPAYGRIFELELENYDFWGHCDIDLIWGKLNQFINHKILSKYDKIYRLGHLSLYRNNEKCNNAFLLKSTVTRDFFTVALTNNSCIFDEKKGINAILDEYGYKIYAREEAADITFKRHRMTLAEDNNYPHQLFYIKDGRCLRDYVVNGNIQTDEFPYIHLQKRQYINTLDSSIKDYIITINKFIPLKSNISIRMIYKLNPYYGKIYEQIEYVVRNIRFRIHSWIRKHMKPTYSK